MIQMHEKDNKNHLMILDKIRGKSPMKRLLLNP